MELRETRRFFALPVELDIDRGAANGDASILRIQPLYSVPLTDGWKLVNLDIVTLADAPGGTPAFPGGPSPGRSAGLTDLLHASFFTPTAAGKFIWGVGPILSLPTATDDSLGSDWWAGGPAVRLVYRTDRWNLGFVAGQRWSFGDNGRGDVHQLLIRGAIRRQLPNDWYFVSAPLITSNWRSQGERWLIPAGGGIGRKFRLGKHPWAWSVQGYHNIVKPDPAPDWVIRFAIIVAIPFGD